METLMSLVVGLNITREEINCFIIIIIKSKKEATVDLQCLLTGSGEEKPSR